MFVLYYIYVYTYISIYVLCTSMIWYNMRGVKSLNLAIGPKSIQSWDRPCQLVSRRRHGPKHPLLQTWVAGWFRSPRIGVNGSWFLLISWLLWRSYSPISNVPRGWMAEKHWENTADGRFRSTNDGLFFSVDKWHIWAQSIQETLCIPNVLHVFCNHYEFVVDYD